MWKFWSLLTIAVLLSISGSAWAGDPDNPFGEQRANRPGGAGLEIIWPQTGPRRETSRVSPPGKHSHALQFDGTSTCVDLGPALDFTKNSPFSVSFWMNSTAVDQQEIERLKWRGKTNDNLDQQIVGKCARFFDHSAPGWTVFTNKAGFLYLQLNAARKFSTSELQAYELKTRLCDAQWHYVVVSYNGNRDVSGVAFFIDGAAQPLGTDSNNLQDGDIRNEVHATIGATSTGQGFFHGALDEMQIFDRALTAADAAKLYAAWAGNYGAVGVNSLVAGYHLDEGRGTMVADFSGHGNTGTLHGGVRWVPGKVAAAEAPPPAAGKSEGLHFDGRDGSYVEIPTLDMGRLTFATWVKREVTAKKQYMIMCTRYGGWGVYFSEIPGSSYDGRINDYLWFTHRGAGGWRSDVEIADTKWHFVAVTLDGNSLKFYVDGKPAGSASMGYTIDSGGGGYCLGGAPESPGEPGCSLQGCLEETLVFNRPLGPAEIAALYKRGRATPPAGKMAGLVAGYHFDEGRGTTVADFSGHDNTGTLRGGVTWVQGKEASKGTRQFAGAVVFDGTDYFGIGNPSDNHLDLGATATMETWVRFDALPNNSIATFLSKDEGPYDRNKWIFAYAQGYGNVAHATVFHINSPETGPIWLQSKPWTPVIGRWYHLALVKNGNQYTFFRDGMPDGTAATTAAVPEVNFDLLMGQSEGGFRLQGAMYDVRLWNTALTSDQVQAGMNGDVTRGETGLVGHWFQQGKSAAPALHAHALHFDGRAGSRVVVPNLDMNRLTFATWVKRDVITKKQYLIMSADNGGWGVYFSETTGSPIPMGNNNYVWFTLRGANCWHSDLEIADTQWHFVAVTLDRQLASFYIDGKPAGRAAMGYTINSGGSRYCLGGTLDDPDCSFQGSLEETLVFNRPLDPSEIAPLYNRGRSLQGAGKMDGLVAGYRFDEGRGTTVADFSGHGNTGTLHGGVKWIPATQGRARDGRQPSDQPAEQK